MPAFRKLLFFALFLTFDLIMFGTFVRVTDAGLGCPDWPGCYGKVTPLGALDTIRADEATITFTPYHFLLNMPSSVPPSGESITATEAALPGSIKMPSFAANQAWASRISWSVTISMDPLESRIAALA